MGSTSAPAAESQVAHVRQLGVPHLVVAFDAKVEEACRKYSILYHRDDEGTAEGCAATPWRVMRCTTLAGQLGHRHGVRRTQ